MGQNSSPCYYGYLLKLTTVHNTALVRRYDYLGAEFMNLGFFNYYISQQCTNNKCSPIPQRNEAECQKVVDPPGTAKAQPQGLK